MTGVNKTSFKPSQASKAAFKQRCQRLDLETVVSDLVRSMYLSQTDANKVLSRHRSPEESKQHPLEYIASLALNDACQPGHKLELERLLRWLAGLAGQEYREIDTEKIDTAAVTLAMSHAYAKRHEILALEVNDKEIIVASAHPWYTSWEDEIRNVNHKTLNRVVANPSDIERCIEEVYSRIAESGQETDERTNAGTTAKPKNRTVFNHSNQRLNLATVVSDLIESKHLSQSVADDVLSRHRSPNELKMHPLEYIASLGLEDSFQPGKILEIEWLMQWLSVLSGQEYIHIDPLKIDVPTVTNVMSHAYAVRHGILALEVNSYEVVIASAHPWYTGWEDNLQHVNQNKAIRRVVANPAELQRFTSEFYRIAQSVQGAVDNDGVQSNNLNNFEQMLELGNMKAPDANDQHIVNIVDWLLQYAFEQRASDIHVEPRREYCNLRFRIDGVLQLIYQMPTKVAAAVISRLKILGRMNVAEKRKPQDGRLKTINPDGNEIELRLSTLPTAFGEKLVMRVFDPEVLVKVFSELGFSKSDERRWSDMISQPSGIILVTGPTGSGKTTTLYSTLKLLATEQVNVCTIEDPIEMVESSFNQMQVQPKIDLTFASGLRALLRQDPDIIMVGEIRDFETADMAVQAALTGHLVISTLHTNDAPSVVTRLMELGIPPYLIRATLLGVMAQRLVRTLCPSCKHPMAIDKEGWKTLTKPWSAPMPAEVFTPVGCQDCRETGYRGRAGVYEIMPMSEAMRSLLSDDIDLQRLRRQAVKEGMYSLRLSGAQKVASGLTTFEEVVRVTPDHNNH